MVEDCTKKSIVNKFEKKEVEECRGDARTNDASRKQKQAVI
jgi:hypothetical protein